MLHELLYRPIRVVKERIDLSAWQPRNKSLIITVAINGSLGTKDDNPNIPVTPEEIIEDAVACCEAGASVVHIHARTPDQKPSHDYDFFAKCIEGIRDNCDIITQISTGSRGNVDRETRVQAADLKPDMMSLNSGCCNFPDRPYINSLSDIEYWLGEMRKYSVIPEIECFDLSHLYTGLDMAEKGLIDKPLIFNIILGMHGALPFTPKNFMHMWDIVPEDALVNSIGVGRYQLPATTLSTVLGGMVRVGLEDNQYYAYKVLASNVQLVERAVRIGKELQRDIATPAESRKLLGIKNS